MIGKLQPQDQELEQIVLGAILIKQDILLEISELLSEETFVDFLFTDLLQRRIAKLHIEPLIEHVLHVQI